jgi:polyisoprenoid-binding protein YceI
MKRIGTLVFMFSLSMIPPAYAGWELDAGRSSIKFKTSLLGMEIQGRFGRFRGTVAYDERAVTKSSVDIAIDAASVDTGNGIQDEKVRGEAYLDAAEYPTIRFRSGRVERVSDGRLRVAGTLDMRGAAREITLELTGPAEGPAEKDGRRRVTGMATARIDPKDYGIDSVLIGDAVELSIGIGLVESREPL